jgi:hypothetical protein
MLVMTRADLDSATHEFAAQQVGQVAFMARDIALSGWDPDTCFMIADYCDELARQLRKCNLDADCSGRVPNEPNQPKKEEP